MVKAKTPRRAREDDVASLSIDDSEEPSERRRDPEDDAPRGRRLRPVEPGDGEIAAFLRDDLRKSFKDKDVVIDPDDPAVEVSDWVKVGEPFVSLTDLPGIPLGHITVFQGLQDCGKTTALMRILIEAQDQGVLTVLIETERKFSFKRFEQQGGDKNKLLVFPVDCIEEGFDKIITIVERVKEKYPKKKVLVGWDSLGMTPTRAELEGGEGIMSASRVIKGRLRRTVTKLKKLNVGLIFVNHLYKKPNVMFGDGSSGYGGSGVYFAAVLVAEFKAIGNGMKKRDGKMVFDYVKAQIKIKKNHISAAQARKVEVRIGLDGFVLEEAAAKDKKKRATVSDDPFEAAPRRDEDDKEEFDAEADDL